MGTPIFLLVVVALAGLAYWIWVVDEVNDPVPSVSTSGSPSLGPVESSSPSASPSIVPPFMVGDPGDEVSAPTRKRRKRTAPV